MKATKGDIIRIYIPELRITVFGYTVIFGDMVLKSNHVVSSEKTAIWHMTNKIRSINRDN